MNLSKKVNNSKPQQNKVGGCNMAVIHIDGKTYDVDGSGQSALSLLVAWH